MKLRILLTALAALGAFSSLFVFDAVWRLDAANVLTRGAVDTPAVRTTLLHRAEGLLYGGAVPPINWHGGAAEAASWTAGLLVVSGEGDAAERARLAAIAAVRAAPVQPIAFMRLAALPAPSQSPSPAPCTGADCLERSWIAARMIEPEAACTRLDLSLRLGAIKDDDPRFSDYVHSLRDRDSARRCFVRFPQPYGFRLLLRLNQSEGRAFE